MNIEISPWVQAGFGSLCVMMLGMLFWVIRRLFTVNKQLTVLLKNDIKHVKLSVDKLADTVEQLPCVKTQLKRIATTDPEHFMDHGPCDPHP